MRTGFHILTLYWTLVIVAVPTFAQTKVFLFNTWIGDGTVSRTTSGKIQLEEFVHVYNQQSMEDTQTTRLTYTLEPLASEFAASGFADLVSFLKTKDPTIVDKSKQESKDKDRTTEPKQHDVLLCYIKVHMPALEDDIIRCQNFVSGETIHGHGRGVRVTKKGDTFVWRAGNAASGKYDSAEFSAQERDGKVLQDRMFFVLKDSQSNYSHLVLEAPSLLATCVRHPGYVLGLVILAAGLVMVVTISRRK